MEREQREAIVKLIEENFRLKPESLEFFKDTLGNQRVAEEFSQIAEQPDRRIFIDVNKTFFSESNEFKNFKQVFDIFCVDKEVTHNDCAERKLKGGMKILTALKKYYFEDILINPTHRLDGLYRALRYLYGAGSYYSIGFIKEFVYELFSKVFHTFNIEDYEIKDIYLTPSRIHEVIWKQDNKICFKFRKKSMQRTYSLKKVVDEKEWSKAINACKKPREFVDKVNEKYLSKIHKKSDIKCCLSLNYADWLLASTKNSWSSCFNLEDDRGYWRGLAGIIDDRNRLLIFFTDGKEKEFHGIKSFNMIERCWGFISRPIDKSEGYKLHLMRVYPDSRNYDFSFISPYINGLEIVGKGGYDNNPSKKDRICKYPFTAIWLKTNIENERVEYYTSTLSEDFYGKGWLDDDVDTNLLEYRSDESAGGRSYLDGKNEWYNGWYYNPGGKIKE